MTIGPWFLFDQWMVNTQNGSGIDMDANSMRAIICGDAQVLDQDFVGASGLAKYADLTDELPTAGGYTVGGVALTGKSWALVAQELVLDFDYWEWVITSNISGAKYVVVHEDTTADKFLIQAFDLDIDSPGTNTVTLSTPLFRVIPAVGGLLKQYQL